MNSRSVHFCAWIALCGVSAACSSEPSCMNGGSCDDEPAASDSTVNVPDDAPPSAEPPEVEYLGAATDEALVHLTDAPPMITTGKGIVLNNPNTDVVPRGAPTTFSFAVMGTQGALSTPTTGAPITAPAERPAWQRQLNRSWRELVRLVGPMRVAHAHGTPYNGDAFYLEFKAANSAVVARVFTSQTYFTPSAEQWAAMTAASQPLELSILWGTFEENELVSGGGPYLGLEFEFSIE